MQYLLMCCFNEDRWNGLAEAERAAIAIASWPGL